jgi:hypothetical protein
VPTVFIPDQRSTLHDQLARARFAAAAGAALRLLMIRYGWMTCWPRPPGRTVRAALARRCAEVAFANGAADAAAWIAGRAVR